MAIDLSEKFGKSLEIMSITIDIDEQLLADLGREEVEKELAAAIERLEMRRMAREVIEDLKEIDHLLDGPEWQAARQRAWEQNGHRYLPKPAMNE